MTGKAANGAATLVACMSMTLGGRCAVGQGPLLQRGMSEAGAPQLDVLVDRGVA